MTAKQSPGPTTNWLVAGGLMLERERLLLVENLRRNGHRDWSTPGGVIDPGEDVLTGLTREVVEETGLVVSGWSAPAYTIRATAPEMGWDLEVEVRVATEYQGTINIDDPDGIVTDAQWVPVAEVAQQLHTSPQWVREPLASWLQGGCRLQTPAPAFSYRIGGTGAGDVVVERVDP